MSDAGDDWRSQQEDRLRSAITGAIEYFRTRYDPLTPEEVAWSHGVAEWLRTWRAWVDGEPKVGPPPVPSPVEPSTVVAMVDEYELSSYKLREKHLEWRRLWGRTQGLIASFQAGQGDAQDDCVWKARVLKDMHALLATSYRDLALAHPGMPRIGDINGAEIIRALYSLGEYASDEDFDAEEDIDLDDDDLAEDEDLSGPEQPLS